MPQLTGEQHGNDYEAFVDHPRYGRGPRITGLDPRPLDDGVHLHWNSITHQELQDAFATSEGEVGPDFGDDWHTYVPTDRQAKRIPNTAIVADLKRQTPATVPVTHYFDVPRECCDCKRPFIFFAAEQKHWYEELGFGLESDCIRCVECRKREQGTARHRETYEQLFHVQERSVEQNLEMAEACLALIEAGVFPHRKTGTVRMLFNAVPKEDAARTEARFVALQVRLLAAERQSTE